MRFRSGFQSKGILMRSLWPVPWPSGDLGSQLIPKEYPCNPVRASELVTSLATMWRFRIPIDFQSGYVQLDARHRACDQSRGNDGARKVSFCSLRIVLSDSVQVFTRAFSPRARRLNSVPIDGCNLRFRRTTSYPLGPETDLHLTGRARGGLKVL